MYNVFKRVFVCVCVCFAAMSAQTLARRKPQRISSKPDGSVWDVRDLRVGFVAPLCLTLSQLA